MKKIKDRLVQPIVPGGGGGPFAGGSGGAGQTTTFTGATPLGHPLAPILANWLDNHMFVASTLIGFTVMERFMVATAPCHRLLGEGPRRRRAAERRAAEAKAGRAEPCWRRTCGITGGSV